MKKHHVSTVNKTPDAFQVRNIQEIIKIEQQERISMGIHDRIATTITAFSGSMTYVILHIIWFGVWIVVNMGWVGFQPFDPFPFSLLTMIVSLEAIFLSSFVLISQNKQALQADKRAKVDLEVNMIAEQEITKLLEMMTDIQHHLGVHKHDEEIAILTKTTSITKLADAIDTAEKNATKK